MKLQAKKIHASRLGLTLTGVTLAALVLGACSAPDSSAYGNRDSFNPAPFWERNDQRDR